MDHPPRSGGRQPPSPAGKQPLRLTRCKSESQNTHLPSSGVLSNKSNTVTKTRSISTTKSRNYKEPEVNNLTIHLRNPMAINTSVTSPAAKKKAAQDAGSRDNTFVRILPRKKPTSPSAWALSPGRVAPCPSPVALQLAKPPSPVGRTTKERGSGGISGVLKYFRQKKAASTEDADRLSFRLMNNWLLQWRFANARAEAAMTTVKTVAETKLFNAWLKILAVRNSNMVKRMEVQKLANDIKLYHIMNSQLFLLEKWSTIEAKNFEAVGRVVRKLSVASVNIPLLHDTKGDVLAVSDVLDTATTLLEDINSTITKLYYQAEKSCYLLTELSIIAKQEKESLIELQTWMDVVASLKEKERSLQAHMIQTN